jgi:predicted transcriptional regulator
MVIELSGHVEEELRDLAERQGRNISAVVEEAVRDYLEAAAITDLEAAEVGETQEVLVGELRGISQWKDGRA